MEIKGKIQQYDWRKCTFNPLNPRRNFDTTDIDASVREFGVKEPVLINQDGLIYKGARRVTSISKTNHPTLPAIVIDDSKMTETEKFELIFDHSESKPLDKAECFNAVKELFHLSYGQTAVIKRCAACLNQAFGAPSVEKIRKAKAEAINCHEDPDRAEEEVIKTKHRGTVQNMERLAHLPSMVADEYLKAWQGNNSLLTQKDVQILAKFYEELWKADPSVTRDNPPQAFIDKFEELKAINSVEDEPGAEKLVRRTKADIENMMKACEDAKVRRTLAWVLGEVTDQAFLKQITDLSK
jgi:hypothetical protein